MRYFLLILALSSFSMAEESCVKKEDSATKVVSQVKKPRKHKKIVKKAVSRPMVIKKQVVQKVVALQVVAPLIPVAPIKKEKSALSFSGSFSPSYNMQAQQQPDSTRAEYMNYEFAPMVKYNDYSLLGIVSYNQDLKDNNASEWQDAALIASHKPYDLGTYLKVSPSLLLGLPMTKNSREAVGLKYTLGAALNFSLNTKNLGLDAWVLKYSIGFTRMFTEYSTKVNGDPVTCCRIRNKVGIGYNFTDKLNLDTGLQFDTNISSAYVTRYYLSNYQTLSYQITEIISASIGHSSYGPVYSVQQGDSDYYLENTMKLYDPSASEIAIGLSFGI